MRATARFITWQGKVNIKRAEFAGDGRPLDGKLRLLLLSQFFRAPICVTCTWPVKFSLLN
jgi:hypothetical protein